MGDNNQNNISVTLSVNNIRDLPKLRDGVRNLLNGDALLKSTEGNGKIIITAVNDVHLQVSLSDLKNYCKDFEYLVTFPPLSFRETIIASPPLPLLFTSNNNHNQIRVMIEPLSNELCEAVEKKEATMKDGNNEKNKKRREETLIGKYGWEEREAKKVWCFAPDSQPVNVFINATTDEEAPFLNEVEEIIIKAFKAGTLEGPLCGEPLRGVKFCLSLSSLHSLPSHRNQNQISSLIQNALSESVLAASPRLVEAILLLEIVVPEGEAGKLYGIIETKRGTVISQVSVEGTPLCTVHAHLPEMNYYGIIAEIRGKTNGQAFPQSRFSHWQLMEGDPYLEGSLPNLAISEIRTRKGFPPLIPRV